MKKTMNIILIIGLIGFFTYKFVIGGRSVSKESLPDLKEQLINGESFDIQSLNGNIVLIDFWGSWCPPCRYENPKIANLYSKYHGKSFKSAKNFEIVSIAIEKNDKRVKQAIEKDGLVWPYHIVKVSKILLGSGMARRFGVTDLPAKFLYDQDGKLIGKNLSITEIEEFLENQLKN